jgi:hypothetical protein
MRSFRSKPTGWRNDNHRHYLAAKFGSAKRYFTANWNLADNKFTYPGYNGKELEKSPNESVLESLRIETPEKGWLVVGIPERDDKGKVVKDDEGHAKIRYAELKPEDEAYGLVEQEKVRRQINKQLEKGTFEVAKADAVPYFKSFNKVVKQRAKEERVVEKSKALPRELARGLL